MEKYRPTQQQIVEAKLGSNELFDYNVPDYLQPNNLRHSENISMFTGFKNGIYYREGVPMLSKEKQAELEQTSVLSLGLLGIK